MAHDSDPAPPVAPGDVLADKYKVERVLGAGGMGVVVAATHLELQERVAVKFLHPEALDSTETAARFIREARVAVKIRSENVARVIDVGRLDNGAPYMVMEYLEGEDLSQRVQRGPLPIDTAVDFVIQACAAMAEAHKIGVVHRDLKPANLFVVQRSDGGSVIKVLDFGISKLSVPDLSEAGLTKTSTMMGSPFYMSPEQMRSAKDVDTRTDIWALGVILFELLTGTTAFAGNSLPELVASIMTSGPLNLDELRAEVPADLKAVVYRCLEKEPERRYQSVAELAQALAPFANRDGKLTIERISRVAGVAPLQTTSVAAASIPAPADATLGRTETSWSDTRASTGSRAPLLVAGALLGLGALGALGWFVMRTPAPIQEEALATAAAEPPEAPASASPPPKAPEPTPPPVEAVPVLNSGPSEPVTASETEASKAPGVTKPATPPRPPKTKPPKAKPPAQAKPPNPIAAPELPKPQKPPKPAVKNPLSIELK